MGSGVGMVGFHICTWFDEEVISHHFDALKRHAFSGLSARDNDWLPHMKPLLDMSCRGDGQKGFKGHMGLADEDIGVNCKDLVMLPDAEKVAPDYCGKHLKGPICSNVRLSPNFAVTM
jgi:hypothetical protein